MKANIFASATAVLMTTVGFAIPVLAHPLVDSSGVARPFQEQQTCGGPAVSSAELFPAWQSVSKSMAILGGQVSRLEQIAQQQATAVTAPFSPVSTIAIAPAAAPLAGWRPQPTAAGIDCAHLAFSHTLAPLNDRPDSGIVVRNDDYLMSRRLAVRHTAFDHEWDRVRHGGISSEVVRQFSAAMHVGGGTIDGRVLTAVNRWTNRRIRYEEDSQLYGRADYWANAQMTFNLRAGDCEDIAIAKMQLLARLGVPQSDMFLTIARDLVRNADHAMLIVKRGNQYWLLDNGTDRVLDASANYDYRPIMSFSGDKKWLHGFTTSQLAMN